MIRPKTKRKRCGECGRLRGRLHIEWHPGTGEWQCSDDVTKCSKLFQQRWTSAHRSGGSAGIEDAAITNPPPGFAPTCAERNTLGRIHDGAPPTHIGDLTRRLVKRILAVACPNDQQ